MLQISTNRWLACFVCIGLLTVLAAGASAGIMPNVRSQIGPLAQARNQSIRVFRSAKHDFGAQDINELDLKYAALQSRANAYLGSVVEAVSTGSFDVQKSERAAIALKKAIRGFNGSLRPLVFSSVTRSTASPARVALPLPDRWVDSMQAHLSAVWPHYRHQLATLTSEQRTVLAEQIKHAFAWPEFQQIQ